MVRRADTGSARLVLIAMILANGMILVDQTAVPLALPAIMQGFGVQSQAVQWVLNGSLLPLAGLLVFGGRLGDLLGRRRVFVIGLVVFAGASAVGGLAPSFSLLLVARVAQGIGGALMLPGSVALLSAAFPPEKRGSALGTMGGVAAVAGALGPTIGGVLATVSWRAVLLVNVPLAVACVYLTLRSVGRDAPARERQHVDLSGTVLLCVALVGLVYGLSQTQGSDIGSSQVLLPVAVALLAGVLFVARERRAQNPLMSLSMLRTRRNYLGATISQALAGMAEMGLGVIFPLLLILNLEMTPALAGLALAPATLPMIVLAPVVGRWYDRAGGRAPLVLGFGVLAVAGLVLAGGAVIQSYLAILPGLLLYGIGLALVLTVNDPVSLDSIDEADQGQASGVAATAEQGGGAIGIAVLYAVFHAVYVGQLHQRIDLGPLTDLTDAQYAALRNDIEAAEQTGLNPPAVRPGPRRLPRAGPSGLRVGLRRRLPRRDDHRRRRPRRRGLAGAPSAGRDRRGSAGRRPTWPDHLIAANRGLRATAAVAGRPRWRDYPRCRDLPAGRPLGVPRAGRRAAALGGRCACGGRRRTRA
jgi:EmrB/QacA subfamily drug resistance transporter